MNTNFRSLRPPSLTGHWAMGFVAIALAIALLNEHRAHRKLKRENESLRQEFARLQADSEPAKGSWKETTAARRILAPPVLVTQTSVPATTTGTVTADRGATNLFATLMRGEDA